MADTRLPTRDETLLSVLKTPEAVAAAKAKLLANKLSRPSGR